MYIKIKIKNLLQIGGSGNINFDILKTFTLDNIKSLTENRNEDVPLVSYNVPSAANPSFYKIPFFSRYNDWSDYAKSNAFQPSVNTIKAYQLNDVTEVIYFIVQKISSHRDTSGTNKQYLLYRPHFYEDTNDNLQTTHTSSGQVPLQITLVAGEKTLLFNDNVGWSIHPDADGVGMLSPSDPQIHLGVDLDTTANYYLVESNNFRAIYYLIGENVEDKTDLYNFFPK
jgi:hypothetical protein